MAIETQIVEVWIAEAENGSIVFDTEPKDSTVRRVCEELTGKIVLYAVTASVSQAVVVGTYEFQPSESEDEDGE